MSVAQTILAQLGGGKFAMLTGAHSFVAGSNDLTFRLPQGKGMRIKLNGLDLYDIDYYAFRGMDVKDLGERSNVYCDQLQDVFEALTGLYVTFAPRTN